MKLVYLDWNIFNKLEHITNLPAEEQAPYQQLDKLILDGEVTVPYSNAHINDLYRGYVKDKTFTPGHLANISRLTKDLCITQYWGEKDVRWHHRDPAGFLDQIIEESPPTSFRSLMKTEDFPEVNALVDERNRRLENTPLPEKFSESYKTAPIFATIFPRCKTAPNFLSLMEDIFDLSYKMKTDFNLYKSLRKFITTAQQKFPQLAESTGPMVKGIDGPKHLTWNEAWEKAKPTFKPSPNPSYDKVVDLFTTTDLKGYRQDERFANLIDDALHAFYASHCDYFLTIDKRCADKARKVFETLKIPTEVREAPQFLADLDKVCDSKK